MLELNCDIRYHCGGVKEIINSIDDERLTVLVNDVAMGARVEVFVDLKTEVEFEMAKLFLYQRYDENDKILSNGIQSWTTTCEKAIDEKDKGMKILAKLLNSKLHLSPYGDYDFYEYTNKRGIIHSHNFTYIRKENYYTFFGALSDKIGFTIFETDVKNSTMNVITDIKGLVCQKRRKLFDFIILYGDKNAVFDRFFAEQNIKLKTKLKLKGFTSWYNYYQNINEEIIDRNLENFIKFKNEGKEVNVFQIDDGFETAVGDWLSIDKAKFPNGLTKITNKINKHFKSGLWLAPFVCETKSEIFKNHKDWILKDEKKNLVHAGHNWSGFYALDIYNEDVRNYLRQVFDTVFNEWNFDLVKLDFLYAACIKPPKNKTRGEVMRDGMLFLREICKDKLILGCGVPLSSAYGLVEYCRIGCDISLDFDGGVLAKIIHNEGVSSHNAILNTIYRDPLNGRAFMNDPDAFILRDENTKMNESEKELLATVNALFGSVFFTSDDFSKFTTKDKKETLKRIWTLNEAKNVKIKYINKKQFVVTYEQDSETYSVAINASKKPFSIGKLAIDKKSAVQF